MKRIFAMVVALTFILSCACCYAEALDLSAMTQEELVGLRNDISARLIPTEEEAVLFDEDGIYIAWFGIEDTAKNDEKHEYQLDFLISNQTDESVYIDFSTISINGFIITTYNSLPLEIPAHTSAFTAATNRWIFDTPKLESIRFSGAFESVAVGMKLYKAGDDGKVSYSDVIRIIETNVTMSE